MNDLFDALRGLFDASRVSVDYWSMRRVLEAAYALDEVHYREVWLPYLAQTGKLPLCHGYTLDEITLLSQLLPEGTRIALAIEDRRFDYEAMCHTPQLSCLTAIDISYKCKLTDAGFVQMTRSPHLGNVVRLDVGGNHLGDEAMAALAEAESIEGLEYLRLYHNEIGARGARALAESPKMKALTELDISINEIGDDGIAAIGDSPHLGNLHTLNVAGNKIKRQGAEAFARTTTLVNLTKLTMGQNSIGNYGALALANCPALSNLKSLSVGRARVNEKGLQSLRDSEHLTQLEQLYHH
ncbi:MAG: hypothetical protein ACE366_23450 [Bradymonadia bacterium]